MICFPAVATLCFSLYLAVWLCHRCRSASLLESLKQPCRPEPANLLPGPRKLKLHFPRTACGRWYSPLYGSPETTICFSEKWLWNSKLCSKSPRFTIFNYWVAKMQFCSFSIIYMFSGYFLNLTKSIVKSEYITRRGCWPDLQYKCDKNGQTQWSR